MSKSGFQQRISPNHPWADTPSTPKSVGAGVTRGEKASTVATAVKRAASAAFSQVALRFTTLKSGVRPVDEFTIEEERIRLAAAAGPLRMFSATSKRVDVPTKQPVQIAHGTSIVKYVRMDVLIGMPAVRVTFSVNQKGSPDTAPSFVLPDEGPIDFIVLPGEDLYAYVDVPAGTSLKVFEVNI